MFIARELTKKFEEIKKGSVYDLLQYLETTALKGEIVLLIDKSNEKRDFELDEILNVLLEEGFGQKEAIKIAQKLTKTKKTNHI